MTLTGAGGAGKTRLVDADRRTPYVPNSATALCYVDLAPITRPRMRCLPQSRARSACRLSPAARRWTALLRFAGGRHMLVVLDNCEHLLDANAALAVPALLGACPGITLPGTSREPNRGARRGDLANTVAVTWPMRRPNCSPIGRVECRPDFVVTEENTPATVREICRRLDSMPLAIELAAARVRALSLAEILDGLHDRFPPLTGGGTHCAAPSTDAEGIRRLVARPAGGVRAHIVPLGWGVRRRVRPRRHSSDRGCG